MYDFSLNKIITDITVDVSQSTVFMLHSYLLSPNHPFFHSHKFYSDIFICNRRGGEGTKGYGIIDNIYHYSGNNATD